MGRQSTSGAVSATRRVHVVVARRDPHRAHEPDVFRHRHARTLHAPEAVALTARSCQATRPGRAGPAIVDWLFAYGSLLPAGHAVLPDGAVAAHLLGWRRSWSVAMDNSVDLPGYKHYVAPRRRPPRPDGLLPRHRRARRRRVNGVALRVGADELPALDERERNYERREVTGQLDVAWRARLGLRRPARRARAGRRGRRERRLAIASSYRERVLAGFDLLRQRRRFEMLTEPPDVPVADLAVVHHRRWPCRAAPAEPCMRLIDLFEVAPEADEAFLADWESERVRAASLYRALRADVDFRFVASRCAPDARGGSTRSSTRRARPTGPTAYARQPLRGARRRGRALPRRLGARPRRARRPARLPRHAPSPQRRRRRPPLRQPRALVEPADVRARDGRPEFLEAGADLSYAAHPALYSVLARLTSPRRATRDNADREAAPRARRSRDAGLRGRSRPGAAPRAGGLVLAGRGRGPADRHPRRRRPRRALARRRADHQPLRGDARRAAGDRASGAARRR